MKKTNLMRKKRILKILLHTFVAGCLLLLIAFGMVWQEFGPVDESGLAGEKIRDPELSADFFYPKGGKALPLVLAMDGSGGGFIDYKNMQFLALEGYAVLSVAYFKAPGRPEKLEEIPLEYFERALHRFGKHPAVDSTKIIVLGISRGAELALLLASEYPQIRGVVAYAPGCFILPSDTKSVDGRFTRSSWTRGGEPFPFAPIQPIRAAPGSTVAFRQYVEPLLERPDREAYTIKVEKGRAAILLLSGGDDQTWPAAEMATLVENRLKRKGYPYPVRNVIYPAAGHRLTLFQESYPLISNLFFRSFPLTTQGQHNWFALGGTYWGNVRAMRAARQEMLTFLAGFK
jgi:dienelactone hydrolase